MLTDQKFIKEEVATFGSTILDSDLEIGNSRFGIGLIMAMAGFVGAWGCLCLISGMIQSQSLQDIGRGIITAFTGI
jgi:hypothetical protein